MLRNDIPLQAIVDMYCIEGWSIRLISKHTGMSYHAVHNRLRKARVTLRPRGVGSPVMLRKVKDAPGIYQSTAQVP